MTPDVVVDIGNSRMKWGLCMPTVADGGSVSLDPDDPDDWTGQADDWDVDNEEACWVVAGVNPAAAARFLRWVASFGAKQVLLASPRELPIAINVEEPEAVGIDRLLGAIAARAMAPANTPVITIDVGTAMTINLVDEAGVFQGGAIVPGPRLMGLALHQHTAKLPLIDLSEIPNDDPPGKNTADAIRAGVTAALMGGADLLVSALAGQCRFPPWLILTGGGVGYLSTFGFTGVGNVTECRELTLEGIRIAAEALP